MPLLNKPLHFNHHCDKTEFNDWGNLKAPSFHSDGWRLTDLSDHQPTRQAASQHLLANTPETFIGSAEDMFLWPVSMDKRALFCNATHKARKFTPDVSAMDGQLWRSTSPFARGNAPPHTIKMHCVGDGWTTKCSQLGKCGERVAFTFLENQNNLIPPPLLKENITVNHLHFTKASRSL